MDRSATDTQIAGHSATLSRLRGKLQALRELGPVYLANFLFQRVIGINRSCRWSVHFTSRVLSPERIYMHRSVRRSFAISGGCYIQARNGLYIGEGTIFAFGVKIVTTDHDMDDLNKSVDAPPIRIGRNCWLASNVVLLPGVELGDNVVVGAGCVVTKSFPSNCVLVGVPARVLRTMDTCAHPEAPDTDRPGDA